MRSNQLDLELLLAFFQAILKNIIRAVNTSCWTPSQNGGLTSVSLKYTASYGVLDHIDLQCLKGDIYLLRSAGRQVS